VVNSDGDASRGQVSLKDLRTFFTDNGRPVRHTCATAVLDRRAHGRAGSAPSPLPAAVVWPWLTPCTPGPSCAVLPCAGDTVGVRWTLFLLCDPHETLVWRHVSRLLPADLLWM
jgi:hypothetical protein